MMIVRAGGKSAGQHKTGYGVEIMLFIIFKHGVMMPSGKRAASLRQQPLSAHLSHYTGVSPHDASTMQNINALRACMTLLREKPFKRRQPSPYPPDFPFPPPIFSGKSRFRNRKTLRLSLRTGLKRFRHGNIILRQGRLRRRSVYGGGTVKMAGNLLGQSGM